MKYIIRSPFFWLLLCIALYVPTRLFHLTALPIFTDEAIYIRWAQIGAQDASWRFISLTDGKQPLFTWLMMATVRIFKDPLYAGRFASVCSGAFSLIGMYALGSELFKNKRVGVFASFLYLISPFSLMYDRMALYDSLVGGLFVWNLYIAVLLVRYVRLDIGLIFGMSLGVGMLNKTSAFISAYLIPFTVLLFDWTAKKKAKRLFQWICLSLLAVVLSQIIYSILRLSPYFYIIAQKDTIFVYPFREWILHPWQFLQGNMHGMFNWLTDYMTWPLVGTAFSACCIFWIRPREKMLLFVSWLAPFVGLALFGKVLYPRYVLFMSLPLYVLVAWMFHYLVDRKKGQIVAWCMVFLLSVPSMGISYWILSDIRTAPLTRSDKGQYINDWPSGWGVPEIVAFFDTEAKHKPITIYTEGTFGLFPYALEIYLVNNENIDIHGIWPFPREIPEDILLNAGKKPTYLVMKQSQAEVTWPVRFITSYMQGTNPLSLLRLYEIVPPKGN